MEREKSRVFERHEDEIRQAIRDELVGRISGERERIETGFKDDKALQTAVALLLRKNRYDSILTGKN